MAKTNKFSNMSSDKESVKEPDAPPLPPLSDLEKEMFAKAKPALINVQNLSGVPWEALAAVWYRESFTFNAPKSPPGGPFQHDPVPSVVDMYLKLKKYLSAGLTDRALKDYADMGVNDYYAGALLAACVLREKVTTRITVSASDDLIKDAFYGYNGRSYGSADNSPYVMNGMDASHKDMTIRGTVPDSTVPGGRRYIKDTDRKLGAMVIYLILKAQRC